MGPGMSARNIALLRSHWTSTILPDKCEPNAAIRGFAAWSRSRRIWIMPRVRFQTDNFQNSPLSPIRAKAASASDTLFGRHAGLRRSLYHSFSSRQPCSKLRMPPRGRFHCLHQRSTCCSDRNRSMVFHVKTMSLYQSRAGTAIWMIPFDPSSRPFLTFSSISKLQQPQEASIRAFCPSIAGMPSASQMQLP